MNHPEFQKPPRVNPRTNQVQEKPQGACRVEGCPENSVNRFNYCRWHEPGGEEVWRETR